MSLGGFCSASGFSQHPPILLRLVVPLLRNCIPNCWHYRVTRTRRRARRCIFDPSDLDVSSYFTILLQSSCIDIVCSSCGAVERRTLHSLLLCVMGACVKMPSCQILSTARSISTDTIFSFERVLVVRTFRELHVYEKLVAAQVCASAFDTCSPSCVTHVGPTGSSWHANATMVVVELFRPKSTSTATF